MGGDEVEEVRRHDFATAYQSVLIMNWKLLMTVQAAKNYAGHKELAKAAMSHYNSVARQISTNDSQGPTLFIN